MITKSYSKIALVCLSCLVLTGCNKWLYEPSFMNQNKIQLEKNHYRADFPTHEVNEDVIAGVATSYARGGDGVANLTITYDPYHKTNDAMNATKNAALLARHLRNAGVSNIKTEILPAFRSGDVSETFISFEHYKAMSPEDCEKMPGLYGDDASLAEEYKMGCGMDQMIAKQIYDPTDLKGTASMPANESDGRRQGNIVETYRTGAPNPPLEGESASQN